MTAERRLAALAQRYALPASAPRLLARLVALVESDPTAPTTVRGERAVIDAHVADALVALELDAVRSARRVADLGSGAGFPGLVLAAALPSAHVDLVEANRRKCDYLRRAVAHVGLPNGAVVCARAEAWPAGLASADLVTARALAPLAVVVEYAAPLLAPAGPSWHGRAGAPPTRRPTGGPRRGRPASSSSRCGAWSPGPVPSICTCTST